LGKEAAKRILQASRDGVAFADWRGAATHSASSLVGKRGAAFSQAASRSLHAVLGAFFYGFVNCKSLGHVFIGKWISTASSRLTNSLNAILIFLAVFRTNIRAGIILLKENLSAVGINVIKNDLTISHSETTRN
jgi:hypothetical protein